MSLTLNPLYSRSLFYDPSPRLGHIELSNRLPRTLDQDNRVSSMDRLDFRSGPPQSAMTVPQHSAMTAQPRSALTGRWLETCPPLRTPAARVIMESSALGTTFPPRAGINHPFRERMRKIGEAGTFHSEPDLTPFSHFSDDEEEEAECEVEDDDQLFEFDMSPERDIVELDDVPVSPERHRAFSITSDSSGGSCSHRKVVAEPEVAGGFGNVFGSLSSGLGSDRRSVQGVSECKSYQPSEWRDYMNECRDSESAPPPPAEKATPIQAAPAVNTPLISPDTPLISPDSLLDGQHLDDKMMYCPECERNTESPMPPSKPIQMTSTPIQSSTPTVPTSTPIPATPILSSGKTTCSNAGINDEELVKMLGQLEVDRGYPGVRDNSAGTSIDTSMDTSIDTSIHTSINSSPDTEEENKSQESTASTIDLNRISSTASSMGDDISPLKEFDPLKEAEESDFEVPKLRKCSSLKSGRTPPGTPSQRKIVRFADIFGLDLSEVKTFTDEIPKIPKCAFQDLDVDIADYDIGSPRSQTPIQTFFKSQSKSPESVIPSSTSLVPMFNQPGCSPSFYETVTARKVCLENAFMETSFTMGGIVRVSNLSFSKAVTVRWSSNDWNSSTDVSATYVEGSSDGSTDKFKFRVSVGCLPVGSRVQFCLRYNCGGQEYWDNNNGANYVFQVFLCSNSPSSSHRLASSSPVNIRRTNFSYRPFVPSQSPSIHADDPWMRFM